MDISAVRGGRGEERHKKREPCGVLAHNGANSTLLYMAFVANRHINVSTTQRLYSHRLTCHPIIT